MNVAVESQRFISNLWKDIEIPVDKIKPSKFSLRDVDGSTVKELAESIKANGLLQPIMVRPSPNGYELVFGLHRLEACKQLGWEKIPAVLKDVPDDEVLLMSIVENLQRNIHVNPIAEARSYKFLMTKGWTVPEISAKIGKTDKYVYERLRLLYKLHPKIRKELDKRVHPSPLTPSHLERLALIDDPQLQLKLARLVQKKRLSVRQLERLTRKLKRIMPAGCLCKKCSNYPCKYIPGEDDKDLMYKHAFG
ncbi:ParB/RepB/Spo0J family partition protein [Candidatus Hecatella orcuttiae]|jgi:ParB family chromosome partitioning protein|uniref:ParB/RepB/Spo0J family partition protein n=1 Tax=Candidatus Hecatella orcuttiae TaxID=1935119 RepID=UPI002867BBC9|nr:ParB/RepB/Spo0J family partition protein [Candidatus Hecatella orcuttiae]